jgi:hypothetical protein
MGKHWVYGSGMFGCLYDYGPNVAESRDDAIDALVGLFGEDLTGDEEADMRRALEEHGQYRFERPQEAGAQYAELEECDCDSPRDHDPDYEAD